MASTSTTTVAGAIRTIFEENVNRFVLGQLKADKYANKKNVSKGAGGTVRFQRLRRPAINTTAASYGTLLAAASAKAITSEYYEVTPVLYQDAFGIDDGVDYNSLLLNEDFQKLIASQAARSLNQTYHNIIGTQGMRHRVDADATYEVASTPTTNGTTTTLVDTVLTQADDFWGGGGTGNTVGYVTITSPESPNFDETRRVTDFVAITDTATVDAFPLAVTTACNYRIVSSATIAATDKLTVTGLLACRGQLSLTEADLFSGGTLKGYVHPNQMADLETDSVWQNIAIYSRPDQIDTYGMVRVYGIELTQDSQVRREGVGTAAGNYDGVYAANGTAYVAPIFGDNSHSIMPWGGGGDGNFNLQFIYTTGSDSGNLVNSARWIGWKAHYAGKVDRATSVVNLVTGATSPILIF